MSSRSTSGQRDQDHGAVERRGRGAAEERDGGGQHETDGGGAAALRTTAHPVSASLGIVEAVRPSADDVERRDQRREHEVGVEVEGRELAAETDEERQHVAKVDEHHVEDDGECLEASARHLRPPRFAAWMARASA